MRTANEELEKKVAERTAALEAQVSDRKRAEISLRELTGRLLRTQDEERRRIARDLHDHAGQTLTALAINLSALHDAAKKKIRIQQSSTVRLRASNFQTICPRKFAPYPICCIRLFLTKSA